MIVARIYVVMTLVVLANCDNQLATTEATVKEKDTNTTADTNEDIAESEPPILPPIILLDFGDNNDNSTTNDEKSKRTINNELGYGYLKNNLFNGKYNYYFPGGKTGTTVSIEESLSPFEPKTIIESYKSITERPEVSSTTYRPSDDTPIIDDQPIAQPWTAMFPGNQPVIFGQRTKLRKVPTDYAYSTYTSTAKSNVAFTTERPNYSNHYEFTSNPNYENQYKTFSSTPSPAYNLRYNYNTFDSPTTARPLSSDPTAFNLPRFTVENGVRYENKIVWKYPDGRIANVPASSYINSYTEINSPIKTKINHHNSPHQSTLTRQSLPDITYPTNFRGQSTGLLNSNGYTGAQGNSPRYPTDTITNIHSQRPAQFPMDQETYSSRPGGNPQPQAYDFSYQNNYGLRQRGNVNVPMRNEQKRPISNYNIDSPNAEYTSTTPLPTSFTDSNKVTTEVLEKYTPAVQKYLSKVFKDPTKSGQQQYTNSNSATFIKNNYDNILNYNPSISQYIRDPTSILNAQPTFIQAGNSLVPVIILRVDGARPIQSQPTPNINLKALLQQYLTQYAGGSISSSNNNNNNNNNNNKASNQDFGFDYNKEAADSRGPLNDLTELTQVLRRLSPNADDHTPNLANHRLADLPLKYDTPRYPQKTSYDTVETSAESQSNPSKVRKQQKVKSVQIIEDPRYSNYKTSR